jgi:hypothetical protein
MFGNRSRSDASTEGKAPKRRREGRGLGPFSSGHLTIIVVTVVIVIAFPFAAFAVSGSNVFVTDATSGVQAKVDASGNLQTRQNGAVVVTGAVTALPALPAQTGQFHDVVTLVAGCGTAIIAQATTTRGFVVTAIKENVDGGAPVRVHIQFTRGEPVNGGDAIVNREIDDTNFTGNGSYELHFPSGLLLPAYASPGFPGYLSVCSSPAGSGQHAQFTVSGTWTGNVCPNGDGSGPAC